MLDRFFRFLGSLQLAIALLVLISVFCIAGTLLPQGTEAEIIKTTIPSWAKALLLTTGMNQMFSSPPFLALLTAFLFNLALATQEQVWPPFRMLFKPPLVHTQAALKAMPVKVPVGDLPPDLVAGALKASGFKVWEAPTGPAAHKGRWSRSAPMMVHISMFFILIGVLITGFWGFKSQTLMEAGEVDSLAAIVDRAHVRGPLVPKAAPWSLRLDKFWLDHYENGAVMQYNSDVTVLQDGKPVETAHLEVNTPLVYDGITFYQSSWDISSVILSINGERRRMPMFPIEAGGHAGQQRLVIDGVKYTLYLPAMKAPVLALDEEFKPVAPLVRGSEVQLGSATVSYEDQILASGFQVKGDPGWPLVFFGWALMSVGLIMIFFGYHQVWYDVKNGCLVGKANRGLVLLERELERIADSLRPAARSTTPDPLAEVSPSGVSPT